MSIKNELDRLGKDIVKEARKNASKNKKTGKLDRSIDYKVDDSNLDEIKLTIEEAYYGKFLNDKTNYMDKAIESGISKHLDNIVDALIDEITEDILKYLE